MVSAGFDKILYAKGKELAKEAYTKLLTAPEPITTHPNAKVSSR